MAVEKEVELVVLALLDQKNLNFSKATSRRRIEEWQLKTIHGAKKIGAVGGCVRVRAYNDKDYEITTKVFHSGGTTGDTKLLQATECNVSITREYFNAFKSLAPVGSIRERYTYPIEGTKSVWEVDIYYDEHGKMQPWAKLDLEFDRTVDSRFMTELPPLPIPTQRIITGERTPAEDALAAKIFDTMFYQYHTDSIMPIQES